MNECEFVARRRGGAGFPLPRAHAAAPTLTWAYVSSKSTGLAVRNKLSKLFGVIFVRSVYRVSSLRGDNINNVVRMKFKVARRFAVLVKFNGLNLYYFSCQICYGEYHIFSVKLLIAEIFCTY